jgi:carbonic anhydrase
MSRPPAETLSRRGALALLGASGLSLTASLTGCRGQEVAHEGGPASSTPSPSRTPREALARLRDGNARFAAGRPAHPRQDGPARSAVAEHQHPWAIVHGCVDSRVAPELLFDQGIGDLFTTRAAGAVLDDTTVGSMEFAVSLPYAVPLVVVLGHTGCGAVAATLDALAANPAHPSAPGEIGDIVARIAPVARRATAAGGVADPADEAARIDAVVRAHTRAVARSLVRRSAIIREAVDTGRTRVVAATYDLHTGAVGWES